MRCQSELLGLHDSKTLASEGLFVLLSACLLCCLANSLSLTQPLSQNPAYTSKSRVHLLALRTCQAASCLRSWAQVLCHAGATTQQPQQLQAQPKLEQLPQPQPPAQAQLAASSALEPLIADTQQSLPSWLQEAGLAAGKLQKLSLFPESGSPAGDPGQELHIPLGRGPACKLPLWPFSAVGGMLAQATSDPKACTGHRCTHMEPVPN